MKQVKPGGQSSRYGSLYSLQISAHMPILGANLCRKNLGSKLNSSLVTQFSPGITNGICNGICIPYSMASC